MDIPSIVKHYNENRNRYVKRAAFRLGNDAYAEDAVQECYLRVMVYAKSYNGDNPDKWISIILGNCIEDIRKQELGHSLEEFAEEEADGTECPSYSEQLMRQVYEMIEGKLSSHKEVLLLHFKHEYSAREITNLVPLTYANCHKIISRFRQELQEKLTE